MKLVAAQIIKQITSNHEQFYLLISQNRQYIMQHIKKRHSKPITFARAIAKLRMQNIKTAFSAIKNKANHFNHVLNRIATISSHNKALSLHFAWLKMKNYALLIRQGTKTLNSTFILARKIQQSQMHRGFTAIIKYVYHIQNKSLVVVNNFKYQNIRKLLLKLYKQRYSYSFTKINAKQLPTRTCQMLSRMRSIQQQLTNRIKCSAFSAIVLRGERARLQAVKQLHTIQVQDLKVQVQNKVDSINAMKQQSRSRYLITQTSFLDALGNSPQTDSCRSRSMNRPSLHSNSQFSAFEGSSQDNSDYSYRLLFKSPSHSGKGSADDNQYKKKLVKYKQDNESLRKKLKTVKQELEFTKELNESVTKQVQKEFRQNKKDISAFSQMQLKRDMDKLIIERNHYKNKSIKYQKYIGSITQEFKVKMEDLYKKAKKNY